MKDMTTFEPATEGQFGKVNEVFTAAMRKHKDELPKDALQTVLGDDSLGEALLAVIKERVEAVSGMLIRKVTVNRKRSGKEALKATGRTLYVTDEVVDAMPKGEGETAEVYFFKVGSSLTDEELDQEYEKRGLKPADPYSQAAVNEADPAFADEHPNGTHWKDQNGKWCFAAFGRFSGGRRVFVYRYVHGWNGRWWFAGVRK
ncbi:MAG: hypothetical protein K9M36_01395 [Candidatus Pacebacteria bacterium]|nr:hypothetical protein [Candidatus Paceibacterota bacterium]